MVHRATLWIPKSRDRQPLDSSVAIYKFIFLKKCKEEFLMSDKYRVWQLVNIEPIPHFHSYRSPALKDFC
jgi:hypothetical protein